MSHVVTAEQLMTDRVPPTEEVPIEGLGVVRVRGLSRAKVLALKAADDDSINFEARLVSAGLVEPAMTPEQVVAWQEASVASELEEVTKVISGKSGLTKGADKEAYKSAGE